jgi:hypothetical protein
MAARASEYDLRRQFHDIADQWRRLAHLIERLEEERR